MRREDVTFDPAKNGRNIRERGLSFERAVDFDFRTALFAVDNRREYGETRIVAVGYLDNRLHVLCFIERDRGIRAISFRRANSREVRRYERAQALNR